MIVSPSYLPTKISNHGISCIVPKTTRPTGELISEHSSIVITERGVADLRGLSPIKRAHKIIENCVHPSYELALEEYLKMAIRDQLEKDEPHSHLHAFKMQESLKNTGSMHIKTWNGVDLFQP